jgi:hypothetical protein
MCEGTDNVVRYKCRFQDLARSARDKACLLSCSLNPCILFTICEDYVKLCLKFEVPCLRKDERTALQLFPVIENSGCE